VPTEAKRRPNGRAVLIEPSTVELSQLDRIVGELRGLQPAQLKPGATTAQREQHVIAMAEYRLKLGHHLLLPNPNRTNVTLYLMRLGIANHDIKAFPQAT
jgi:hypothetical protein